MGTPVIVGETGSHATGLISGGMDENGEVTSTLMYRVQSETECATYKRGQRHPELDIPETSRTWSELEGCLGFDLTIKYKGKLEDEEDEDDYSLDVSFSEEPIQSHPNFEYIKKRYRGTVNTEGEVEFQEYIRLSGKGNQSQVKGSKGFVKNPMYGHETWLVLKAVLRREYVSNRRPSLSMIGKIVKQAPGGFQTPEDHDWLIMPPKSRRKGRGTYANAIEYLLSPIGGWPEGVYETMEGRTSAEDTGSSLGGFGETGLGDEPFAPSGGWEL
jgi:hypothetical protein